ncbi:beta-propeller fold lactonase family protein [Streptomyces sp. NPDC001177]
MANHDDNNVSVIDTSTDTVVGTPITVGAGPIAIAMLPNGTKAYVSNELSNNVSVIDTADRTVTATIGVGVHPRGIAVTPDGTKAYVADNGSNEVSVIDTATNTVTGSPITVGTSPNGLDILPNGSKVYVANAASNSVSVINTSTDTVSTTITTNIGANPQDTVATENGQKVYVPNHDDNNVSVIDTATDTASPTQVSVGTGPGGAAASPSQGDTVVTFQVSPTDGLTITVPDTATLSTVTPGGTATGQLGNVTVNDQRSLADATWNSTASLSQDFTTSGGSPISGGAVTYTPGAPVAQTNGPFTAGTPGTLAGARTAYSKTSGSGDNSVTWNPTLDVAVPAAAVAGIYTGTITHSVA